VPWSLGLQKHLLEEFPLPASVKPIPDNVQIPPKWTLQFVEEAGREPHATPVNGIDEPPYDLIPISSGLTATIHQNDRVTDPSHFQNTRHVILSIPGDHAYPPGATLTIYPKNYPSDVNELISLMEWTDIADRSVRFVPSDPEADLSQYPPPPINNLPEDYNLTIRKLLTSHLDIMSIPRRSFFAQLIHHTTDEMHLERLREFVSPELIDELYDYTTRPRRSIVEVLSDFNAVRLPWHTICSIIPVMRGRQFSIASGGALKSAATLPPAVSSELSVEAVRGTRIDLLIAIVKYRTVIKRIRHGIATRYIAALRPGQQITVSLQPGGLGIKQSDINRPVVMVAPGTGVAPMRSLALERKAERELLGLDAETSGHIKDMLFFGCRKKGMDEYFATEWEALGTDVSVACSRDQLEKVYVQDLVRREAPRVFQALAERGGMVFVCG
jgi:sulfite reductase alpha subunit-like flavoprotein